MDGKKMNNLQNASHFRKKPIIDESTYINYNELPIGNARESYSEGTVNGSPCVIFRKDDSESAMNYLMERYPLIKKWFEKVSEYAPTIIDCLEENGHAYYFQAEGAGVSHDLMAIKTGPLWDTAEKDFYDLLNLIHYCEDYQEYPGMVFMDDYDLC